MTHPTGTPAALSATALALLLVAPMLGVSCKKKGEAADAAQPGTFAQPTATATGYYPATTDPAAPTATSTPSPAPAATAASGLSTPSPMATPCQTDAVCLTHRCNTAVGRCAWPCQTNADCLTGNQCLAPLCVPTGVSGSAP